MQKFLRQNPSDPVELDSFVERDGAFHPKNPDWIKVLNHYLLFLFSGFFGWFFFGGGGGGGGFFCTSNIQSSHLE